MSASRIKRWQHRNIIMPSSRRSTWRLLDGDEKKLDSGGDQRFHDGERRAVLNK